MFHLRSGTAGTENNANFERLRQSFSKNGDSSTASPTPASPGPLRKSASCVDAMRSGAAADSSTLPKSGEAVWKTAATAKKMQQQSAAKDTNGTATQPARPASVTPVPIKAPWYRKENYEDAEAAKNGTSAAKQTPIAIKLNRAGTSGGSSQASQPSVSQQQLGKLEKMDPSSLRSNYKFAINLNSDDPINIVRR
ncbi:hypothetical protein AAVH_31230 [Aphelenchoides avenae]|nr:hypothetical protein AAVH_31230 [Aphelenchus avenae]